MRRIAVIAILVVLLSWGMALAFQNEPNGFRGLKWGDPPTEEMEFIRKWGEWTEIYRNPGEERKLGDAKFSMMLYAFYVPPDAIVKRFMTASLYFNGEDNFGILETVCKAKFGEPTREQYQEFCWSSLKSTVELTYDGIEETGYLSLSSGPIFGRYMEERKKQQAESAEKDW